MTCSHPGTKSGTKFGTKIWIKFEIRFKTLSPAKAMDDSIRQHPFYVSNALNVLDPLRPTRLRVATH